MALVSHSLEMENRHYVEFVSTKLVRRLCPVKWFKNKRWKRRAGGGGTVPGPHAGGGVPRAADGGRHTGGGKLPAGLAAWSEIMIKSKGN
ncbi:Acetylglutamate semialdehyde dehydrogenase [Anopheles sinensis]|uniref:Acetylglutamate semialdehyde dehydrogenase n=1 Tax=Anopheles sinensis TaxID=74873 RepID=A0A084W7P9_ANOSI|nr:Acetylglutamate semialdehyde dehydrogenase [Anopheles sinensis]